MNAFKDGRTNVNDVVRMGRPSVITNKSKIFKKCILVFLSYQNGTNFKNRLRMYR